MRTLQYSCEGTTCVACETEDTGGYALSGFPGNALFLFMASSQGRRSNSRNKQAPSREPVTMKQVGKHVPLKIRLDPRKVATAAADPVEIEDASSSSDELDEPLSMSYSN